MATVGIKGLVHRRHSPGHGGWPILQYDTEWLVTTPQNRLIR